MNIKQEWESLCIQWEKARAERKERRIMKTSTWYALSEGYDEVVPDGDAQSIHEDLMHDTIAVERHRFTERGYWVLALIAALGVGWVAGWYAQPQFKPEPWDCTVKVVPDAPLVEPTIMRCVGGEKPE